MREMFSFSPVCLIPGNSSFNGRFGEILKRSEHLGEGRNVVFRPRIKLRFFCCPAHSLVNVPTTVPQFIFSQVLIC